MSRPSGTPPMYNGPRPELVEDPARSGYVSHTDSTTIDAPMERFVEWIRSVELEELNIETPNVPKIVATDTLQGSWDPAGDRAGARRRVVLEGGHYAAEEVVVDEPRRFQYVVWGYTNFARWLIDHAVGEFRFDGDDRQTVVHWTYSFKPRSVLAIPFLAWFVRRTWTGFMRSGLEIMRNRGASIARQ